MSAASSSSSSSSRSSSMTPSLTPSRTPSPQPSTPTDDDNDIPTIPVQPDHFWGAGEEVPSLPNPLRPWLDPNDDPLAHRGIPVFKPTMDEFEDFETYMNRVECWGMKSGIIKIIPPKEWTEALPKLKDQLRTVKIKSPIEQIMFGSNGLFRQENLEKRKVMSVREWAELCARPEFCAPSVKEVVSEGRRGVRVHRAVAPLPPRKSRKKAAATTTTTTPAATATPEVEMQTVEIKPEEGDEDHVMASADDPVSNAIAAVREESVNPSEESPAALADHEATPTRAESEMPVDDDNESKSHHEDDHSTKMTGGKNATAGSKSKPSRPGRTREVREAHAAERAAQDAAFLDKFDPHRDWLPQDTTAEHYTDEFCRKLERQYWRNCGLSTPAWYGADTAGSLYLDETKSWNVAHLDSTLSRLMPSTGVPGVTTPYLYFGMWRATFAWHVEDMDLFSINYIHFGAPKFWYAIPQGRATALEQTMRSYFPKDTSQCPQFLRHKSFLASPTLLAKTSCRPNVLVQRAGEFVITFPRGYHAGFNLGFNCAESVNFALESWLELGRRAQVCKCVSDSVRIDVDQLLLAREAEKLQAALPPSQPKKPSRKSKPKSASANGGPEGSMSTSKAHPPSSAPRKRKSDTNLPRSEPKAKKPKKEKNHKSDASAKEDGRAERPALPKISVKLKLPAPEQPFPCCLCVSMNREGLLRVLDPPVGVKDPPGNGGVWMAHESCASVVPETWVDDVELSWTGGEGATAGVGAVVDGEGGETRKEKVVYGVDGIPKDRWNLKCTACIKTRHKAHGAPIQCTKGKCPRAFHVSCARDGAELGIVYEIVREVEKEVVLIQPTLSTAVTTPAPPTLTPDSNPDPVALSLSRPDPVFFVTPGADAAAGTSPSPISSEKPMEVDGATGSEQRQSSAQPTDPQVLKIIRKQEIKCLCSQHNPDIAAAKRAQRQSKIKTDLLALPAMSRIRVRGDSGVYEVSLLRVNEEAGSVDVIWDGGSRKEIKWGRVIFGDVSGKTIVQKPSEPSKSPTQVDSSKLFIPPIRIPASSNNNHTTGSSSHPTTTATVAINGGAPSAPYGTAQMNNYGYYYHYYYAQAQAAAASGIAPYYGPTYQPYPSSSHQPYTGPPTSYPYAAVPYTASSSSPSNSQAPNIPSQNSANPSQPQQQPGNTLYASAVTGYQQVPSSYQVYNPPGAATPVNHQQPQQQQAYRDIRWQEPYKQKATAEPERNNSAERNTASADVAAETSGPLYTIVSVDKSDSDNASGPVTDEGGVSAIPAPVGASPLTSSLPQPPPPSAADITMEASTSTTISNPPLQSPIPV